MNRKFDDLGRIVIPKEMRGKLGLVNGDEACIEFVDNKIVISNPNDSFEDWLIDRVIMYEDNETKIILDKYRELKK